MTIWEGKGNDIKPLRIFSEEEFNIGTVWSNCTEHIFGLSRGYPKGNQCGTVMAQACMGDGSKYYDYFWNHQFRHFGFNYDFFKSLAKRSEQEMFDIAASLQKATEDFVKIKLEPFIKNTKSKNLCLAGGVVLNSVLTGKMVENWYTDKFENFYTCPVPYDAGLSIGAAQYMWHNTLQQPRIHWENSFTPYLGVNYGIKDVNSALKEYDLNIENNIEIENITTLLAQQKIISVFNEGSESGRRALGNRSILADPRNPNMKNIINEKVKHRQWYRPFAPSILREKMPDWFEFDLDSPYMNYVLTFKDFAANKVPAVVHLDGTGRVQTVTKKDNAWFHQLLTEWNKVSGVPILLNTSFNDREPIVETPKNAIDCFLGTEIDYLYFCEHKILVSKK
jgi:carbamoyltransferase